MNDGQRRGNADAVKLPQGGQGAWRDSVHRCRRRRHADFEQAKFPREAWQAEARTAALQAVQGPHCIRRVTATDRRDFLTQAIVQFGQPRGAQRRCQCSETFAVVCRQWLV